MSTRNVGLVETMIRNDPAIASADATTSGGVIILSVNCTGAQDFTLVNRGSVKIYVNGSFDGSLFITSVAVADVATNTSANEVSASAAGRFTGPYQVIRVLANSGSGVYRPTLIYR